MKNLRKRWVIWLGLGLVLVCLVSQLSKCKLPVTNPPPGKIAFVSRQHGRSVIYTMESDGSNKVPLTGELDRAMNPLWSPDGQRVAFSAEQHGEWGLWVMDADGSNKMHLFSSQYDTYPRWSPDSTHILFRVRRADGNSDEDIYVVNRDGSNLMNLTHSLERGGEEHTWSPGGTHVAFQAMEDGKWGVYVVDRDGSGLVGLTDHTAGYGAYAWSPNGTRIAFMSDQDDNWEVYVVDRDGSNSVNLTNHPAYDGSPAWSPDGARIAFSTDRMGLWGAEGGLYIMNSDGTDVQRVGRGGTRPVWAPDGDRIVYECVEDLCSTTVEGTSRRQLSPGLGRSFFRVSWSPDGEHVAFVELGSFPPETDVTAPWTYFGVASMSASRRVGLGRGAREDLWLHSWSPDGQYLVFSKGDIETMEIFVVSGDGRRQSQLTHNSHRDWQPAWQPQVP